MDKLTLKNFLTYSPLVDEDYEYSFTTTDGQSGKIYYFYCKNSTTIEIMDMSGKLTEEAKCEGIRAFCKQMYSAGGVLIIYVNPVVSGINDFVLFKSGFFQISTNGYYSFNPNIRDIRNARGVVEADSSAVDEEINNLSKKLQSNINGLKKVYDDDIIVLSAVDNGEMSEANRELITKRIGDIEIALAYFAETYSMTPENSIDADIITF